MPAKPYLDMHEVREITCLGERTIRRMVAAGEFPPPGRGGLWSNMAVAAWMLWRDYGPRPAETAADGDEEDDGEQPMAARRGQTRPKGANPGQPPTGG